MKSKIFLLILMFPLFVFGQQKQPKIGLVLSGGGAKGFAHIGVLKEIDAAGIQLDYIGGTSMGAIVGGLYALGYSGIEIEKIVKNTDFMSLLRDKLPRSSSPFFDKENAEKTKLTLPVSKGKLGLPKGISKGQNVLNLLYELIGSSEEIEDFSRLTIPFFCIATDVETGKGVMIESGSLPAALRASGSFPTLLNPVVLNDKLLVDGGIANNFPVTFMKSKGIDIVIGVDVEGKLIDRDKLTSAIAILNQIVSYQMYDQSKEEKEKLDVYLHPEIFNYTVVDFDKKDEIIEKGEIEAKKFREVFKELAAKQINNKKRTFLKIDTQKKYISKIDVKRSENYTIAYVLGKLDIREGDSISRQEITKRIGLLSATKNYDRIDYALIKQRDNSYHLNFIIKESIENATLSLGAHYDDLYKSGVLVNYSHKHAFFSNDLLSLDLVLGDNLRYDLNYFVDNGFYLSVGFKSRYNHFRANSKYGPIISQFPNISSVNIKYTDITNQLYLQTTFDRKFALGLGVEHKYLKASTETITNNNNETNIDNSEYYNAFAYLKLDTYDKKYFVTKGYFADLNLKWYLNSTDFNNNFKSFAQAQGTLGFATPLSDKITFQNTNEAGFTFNTNETGIFEFYLGGYNQNFINTFVPFYGYDFGELSDVSFLKTEFHLRYAFLDKHYASFIANYARLDNNVFKDIDIFKDIKSGYALGYSFDSLIGPIELKYSWSPDHRDRYWLFNLGFWF
ncbi:patatin-like phospholipase family protein [Polaribacter vadi]|uniref:patatin-like phospholipase family protein n=1 Tax=Polaribacter TaxID=52959 RepID=UPI001C081A15|nr:MULTISPECIES: patatin-like phospholipase family protein [Polaribacter]MBU3011669.1 patatin-like phospholipase family protein [Polaribacter vadi]MDO6741482.1 patatin-like phospholipase family protein [Polaribacter sp. 1_MG-2023]